MSHEARPGCFGSPTARNEALAVCKECRSRRACGNHALTMLSEIARRYPDLAAQAKRPPARRAPVERVGRKTTVISGPLPENKKAAKLVTQIRNRGIDVTAIARGENPFRNQTPRYLEVVIDTILAHKTVTIPMLRDALVEQTAQSHSSASSHANFASHALSFLGVIARKGDKFEVKSV